MTTQVTDGVVPEWTMADRLRKARESAGFKQADLAPLLGISRAKISAYESGGDVRRGMVVAWAVATNVDPDWLLLGPSSPQPAGYPPPGGESTRHAGQKQLSTPIAA